MSTYAIDPINLDTWPTRKNQLDPSWLPLKLTTLALTTGLLLQNQHRQVKWCVSSSKIQATCIDQWIKCFLGKFANFYKISTILARFQLNPTRSLTLTNLTATRWELDLFDSIILSNRWRVKIYSNSIRLGLVQVKPKPELRTPIIIMSYLNEN